MSKKIIFLITWTNIISVLLISGIASFIMLRTVTKTEKLVTKEMENIANSLKITTVDYVWNMQLDALESITAKAVENPSIDSISYIDSKEKVIIKKERVLTPAEKENQKNTPSNVFRLPFEYGAKKEVIGFLEITYNLHDAVELKNDTNKLIVFLALSVILAIGLSTFINKTIKKIEAQNLISANAAKQALSMVDHSIVATMLCAPDGTVLYLNKSTEDLFSKIKQYANGNLEQMVGKNIGIFATTPAIAKYNIADPKKLPHREVVSIGPEKIDLIMVAVHDSEGKYLGASLAFTVVTDRVNLINDLTKSAEDLASAANNVMAISTNLSAAVEETSAQANTATSASEEVNMGVQSVATNINEMVSAIKEITKTTNEAASMTNEAMGLAQNANKIINQLGESSMDIGNVIKVISSIAGQTNLLALNATIEAARAGKAGKGFAVVANEVKELANQTGKATNEIIKKVEAIQADSRNAIQAIAEISVAIEKVNGYTGNIAAAVEEQSATTSEVTRVVADSAEGVKQITENIAQVSRAAASTGKDAFSANTAAGGVSAIATSLKGYVARLKA